MLKRDIKNSLASNSEEIKEEVIEQPVAVEKMLVKPAQAISKVQSHTTNMANDRISSILRELQEELEIRDHPSSPECPTAPAP